MSEYNKRNKAVALKYNADTGNFVTVSTAANDMVKLQIKS